MATKSKKQETQAPQPVWAVEYVDSGEYKSPISIIQIEGDTGVGKSTAAASIAPALPGQPPRTVVFDTERSWANLEAKLSVDVIDLTDAAKVKRSEGTSVPVSLWEAFTEAVTQFKRDLAAGKYPNVQVIVIDSASDLRHGAQRWLLRHPDTFEQSHKYRGDGYFSSWGDANRLFEQDILDLATYVETVVVVTHQKTFEGDTSIDGFTIDRKVALAIELFDERHISEAKAANIEPQRWALVKKQRLTQQSIDEDGELITRPLLPRKILLEKPGQSFFAVIRRFMKNPQADYGDLDVVDDKAINKKEVDESKLIAQKLELALADARKGVINRLVNDRVYKTANDVESAITKVMVEFSKPSDADAVEAALRDYAELEKAKYAMIDRLKSLYPNPRDIAAALKELGLSIATVNDIEVIEPQLVEFAQSKDEPVAEEA